MFHYESLQLFVLMSMKSGLFFDLVDVTGIRGFYICGCCYIVVVLLFYVHGKHLRSCQDGQLA